MGRDEPQTVKAKPRLSRRDRLIVASITILALVAAISASLSSIEAALSFFGVQPSPRESAVGNQSGIVMLWALATPFCCWGVLRGGRRAVGGLVVWLVLVALCRWWWWPSSPTNDFEKQIQPLWQNRWGVIPWVLVGASLVVGMVAAWKSQAQNVRSWAVGSTIAILAIAGLSYLNLFQHAQDEKPTPLAEGFSELEVLKQDPLWTTLPSESITRTEEHPAVLSDWGEKFTTWRSVTLGTTRDKALFAQAVLAAEASGWSLHDSFCSGTSIDGTFTKGFPQGPAYLRITAASYTQGVSLFVSIEPPPGSFRPERCWEN